MKKRILSVLLGCSLLFGTVFANAVSIEFEDLEQTNISEEQSMIEEVIIDENSISSEATNKIINTDDPFLTEIIPDAYDEMMTISEERFDEYNVLSSNIDSVSLLDTASLTGYFTYADNIFYIGQNSVDTQRGLAIYSNVSADDSKYIVYSNAVNAKEQKYDLVIYPFKGTQNAYVHTNSVGLYTMSRGYAGYKLVVTQHGNIDNPISMNVMFGVSDLDDGEYIIVPSNYSEIHKGVYVVRSTSASPSGIKYVGNRQAYTNEEMYNTNCTFGEISIPPDGIIVYYGYNSTSCGACLSFDEIKNYINLNAYTIQFDANGGGGSIPSSVIKYGNNTAMVLGNIGNTVPIKEGYTFKGWSASPTFNNKRIAYSSGNTGATQTSNSWTYADYCNYVGGNPSNRTLTLYAQWEANTNTITYDGNGNTGGSTASQTKNYDIAISLQQNGFTKTGHHFVGWNTSADGSGTSYDAGTNYNINANVTLYAQWEANSYTVTINKGKGIESITGGGTYKYGEDVTINATLLPGYAWENWTGTHSTNTQKYTFKMPASNVTDTANATPIVYNITYDLGDGTVSKENPKTYTVETDTFTLNNPTKTGYTFLGWTGGNGTTPDKNVSVPKGSIEDRIYTANWKVNQYPVTYIDVDSNGNEIGRTTKMVDYGTSVRGAELGNDTSDNAYYNQYRYVSDTSASVTTEGAVVYRVFEFCETEAESNLQWNDNNDADGFRPSKYKLKLKQNGKVIDELEFSSDETNHTFPSLPKYDSTGKPYHYSFEVDASDRYKINFDDNGNLIVEDYQPASFSIIIPKTIVLDGKTGKADYIISVNGTFYYNDTLTVTPEDSLTLVDRSKISSMKADVLLNKTVFTKEDNVSEGITTIGSIQTERQLFAGSWEGSFNFNIHFEMKN